MKIQLKTTKDQELTITQDELRELLEMEGVKLQAENLRKSIRTKFLQGAKVEPGELDVSVHSEKRIQLTLNSVRELLGVFGDQILASLPRQRIFRMFVRPSKSSKQHPVPTVEIDPSDVNNTYVPSEKCELVTVVLNALQSIDVSHPDMQSLKDKLTTLVELKAKPSKLSDPPFRGGFDDAEFYEEEAFLESFQD